MSKLKNWFNATNIKRIIMTVFGVLVCGFSVGMFSFSHLGVDPFQVLAHGIWMQTPLKFGDLYTIVNVIMLIAIIVLDRKKIGLGTVINIFLLGYVVDFSTNLWESLIPDPSFAVKMGFLIVAIVIICFGSALYFTADMGVSTYDAVALYISQKQDKVKFQYCRIASDVTCVVVGFLLGANFKSGFTGIGTVITAFFMGPLIAFFNRTVAIPLLYGKSGMPEKKTE